MDENDISHIVLKAAIEVNKALGPGLLESAYEACLCHELMLMGLNVKTQAEIPLYYKGEKIDCAYRADIIVEDKVIIELKAVTELENIHKVQLLTYLRLANKKLGLLINFNCTKITDNFKRVVNNL